MGSEYKTDGLQTNEVGDDLGDDDDDQERSRVRIVARRGNK